MQTTMISKDAELEEFCQQLEQTQAIAIDTEFMRQKTYYAIPALVQIAQNNQGQIIRAVVDAKTIKNWQPLQTALEQATLCIAHSPDQDFEIFDQLFNDWQFTLIDTQIAAALLGAQPQTSYAAMLKDVLDIDIDKSQSRTDWLRRPLSKAQIDYALADVLHLPSTWKILESKLKQKNRTDWFYYDCATQINKHKEPGQISCMA